VTHFPRPDTIDSLSPVDQRVRPHPVRDYAIVGLAPNGTVTSWNSGAEDVKNYRSEEIIGRHFSVFYRPEHVAAEMSRRFET
jgi:hypothetical protein